jgi:hypothetical protein
MDVLYFLQQRTKFIRHYYDQAAQPFAETMRKIEAEEPPFDDPPYSEDPEPAYLAEWLEANTGREILGRTCVSMLAGSLKLYFQRWEGFLVARWEKKNRDKAFKGGMIGGYKICFAHVGKIDWSKCPVDLDVLEQIVLLRNRDQHPECITTLDAGYWGEARQRFSRLLFTDDVCKEPSEDSQALTSVWGPAVRVSREDLFFAIEQVERLAEWMEPQLQDSKWPARARTRNEANVNSFEG